MRQRTQTGSLKRPTTLTNLARRTREEEGRSEEKCRERAQRLRRPRARSAWVVTARARQPGRLTEANTDVSQFRTPRSPRQGSGRLGVRVLSFTAPSEGSRARARSGASLRAPPRSPRWRPRDRITSQSLRLRTAITWWARISTHGFQGDTDIQSHPICWPQRGQRRCQQLVVKMDDLREVRWADVLSSTNYTLHPIWNRSFGSITMREIEFII